jgi:hypothetical protein
VGKRTGEHGHDWFRFIYEQHPGYRESKSDTMNDDRTTKQTHGPSI